MQQAAVADADPVESGARRVGAVLSEHRDAHRHETRIEIVGADVPLLERARPEVLHEHIGGCREAPHQVLALGGAQIEGHALAAAALDRPEQRVLTARATSVGVGVDERADGAHEVAALGLLDLDDLGALLAEQPGAERCGDARAEVEHTQTCERTGQLVS